MWTVDPRELSVSLESQLVAVLMLLVFGWLVLVLALTQSANVCASRASKSH